MSVSELKRSLTPGTVLNVTMHRYPELSGCRTIVKVNTVGVYLALPDGHPRQAETPNGSFLSWPKASELRRDGGTYTIHYTGWADSLMTFSVEH